MVACEKVYMYVLLDWEAKRSSAKWSFTGGGRIQEVVAYEKLSLWECWLYLEFPLTNKNISYVWYEYEITWGSGQCSFKLFSGFFCSWLIFHVFRFGVPKPTLMICLITLVVISFRCWISISKLNMLFWAAILWLSCCNNYCCVERLLLLWLSALKKFAIFAKLLYSWQSMT